MFDHTCHFKIPKGNIDPEELELDLIDFGADEVFVDEENIMIYGSFENFGAIQSKLESANIEILASGFERIPQNTVSLTPEQTEEVEVLLEKIEEDEDVMNIYHNMA